MTMTRNWSGTLTYSTTDVVVPRSVAHLQEAVAGTARIRALGTRHSFSDVADGLGVHLSTEALPLDLVVSADRRTATVGSGSTYGAVARALEAEGLALANMGSLPHISVGGAVATGTHGSGVRLQSLSASVAALEVVGPDGTIRTIRRGEAGFGGSVVSLGALGVVVRVTLDVEPTYRMRQDTYVTLPWSSVDAHLVDVLSAGTSVSLFHEFDDSVREVLVKSRVAEGADDVDVPDELLGASRAPVDEHTEVTGDSHTPMDGSVGPWLDRLPHFRLDATPSHGSELQSEHFVALDDGAAALHALRALGADLRPHLHTCETRAVAGDDAWLSPTPVDSLAIAFTWRKHPVEVAGLVERVEEVLRPFGSRPHWGKLSSLAPEVVVARYPRFGSFADLVGEVDPGGKFVGPFLERLLAAAR